MAYRHRAKPNPPSKIWSNYIKYRSGEHTDEQGNLAPGRSKIAKIMRGRAKYSAPHSQEDKDIIRRGRKAIRHAEPHIARSLKESVKSMKLRGPNPDAKMRTRHGIYAAAYHSRIKKYGLD